MAYHNELGKIGEDMAVAFLLQEGYTILERNFRYDKAEIDVIAQIEDLIVIVEVKTRNSAAFGNPQEFVTPSKIKLLVKAANEYMVSNNLVHEVRFDIISVLKNKTSEKVEHYPNAFYHF
ncbi:MAG: YraN family protein [Aureisphaera sp.]